VHTETIITCHKGCQERRKGESFEKNIFFAHEKLFL